MSRSWRVVQRARAGWERCVGESTVQAGLKKGLRGGSGRGACPPRAMDLAGRQPAKPDLPARRRLACPPWAPQPPPKLSQTAGAPPAKPHSLEWWDPKESRQLALHCLKSCLLAAAAQLRLPREDRMQQGKHRDSARLYSRDDTIASLHVQEKDRPLRGRLGAGGGDAWDLGSACVLGRDRQRRGEGEAARGRAGRRWGGASKWGRRCCKQGRGPARWGSKQARGVGRPGGWS